LELKKCHLPNIFGFLGDFVINIGGTTNSLGSQDEPSNFISKDKTQVAPVICYESVFGEFVTKYVQKGAHSLFLSSPTTDGGKIRPVTISTFRLPGYVQ
jgi:apolipoprotein N-acyltransferase